jgi:hypothetical protein
LISLEMVRFVGWRVICTKDRSQMIGGMTEYVSQNETVA